MTHLDLFSGIGGEMFRIICEFRPRWVIAENVAGLLTIQQGMVFQQVCLDLEGEGYAVQAFVIPTCAVNASGSTQGGNVADTSNRRCRQSISKRETQRNIGESSERNEWDENWLEVATRLCTLDDGFPNGLVRPKGWRNAALKAAGNAIVPQIAEQIMRRIKNL